MLSSHMRCSSMWSLLLIPNLSPKLLTHISNCYHSFPTIYNMYAMTDSNIYTPCLISCVHDLDSLFCSIAIYALIIVHTEIWRICSTFPSSSFIFNWRKLNTSWVCILFCFSLSQFHWKPKTSHAWIIKDLWIHLSTVHQLTLARHPVP